MKVSAACPFRPQKRPADTRLTAGEPRRPHPFGRRSSFRAGARVADRVVAPNGDAEGYDGCARTSIKEQPMNNPKALWAVGLMLVAPLASCGEPPEEAEVDTATITAALESTGLPNGAVCGLAYRRPDSPLLGSNVCENARTLTFLTHGNSIELGEEPFDTTGSGFRKVADGDRGLPPANGFYHRRFDLTNSVDSRFFRLPRGTACGFKEACTTAGKGAWTSTRTSHVRQAGRKR
jgi:hypothetical protein